MSKYQRYFLTLSVRNFFLLSRNARNSLLFILTFSNVLCGILSKSPPILPFHKANKFFCFFFPQGKWETLISPCFFQKFAEDFFQEWIRLMCKIKNWGKIIVNSDTRIVIIIPPTPPDPKQKTILCFHVWGQLLGNYKMFLLLDHNCLKASFGHKKAIFMHRNECQGKVWIVPMYVFCIFVCFRHIHRQTKKESKIFVEFFFWNL